MPWVAGRERAQLQRVINPGRTNFGNEFGKKACTADISAWYVPCAMGCRDWGVHSLQTDGVPNFSFIARVQAN